MRWEVGGRGIRLLAARPVCPGMADDNRVPPAVSCSRAISLGSIDDATEV